MRVILKDGNRFSERSAKVNEKSSDPRTTSVWTYDLMENRSGWIRHKDPATGRSATFYMVGPERETGVGIYAGSLLYWDPYENFERIPDFERARILSELVENYSRLAPSCQASDAQCRVIFEQSVLRVIDFTTGRSLSVKYEKVAGREQPGLKAGNDLHLQPFTKWNPPNETVPVTDADRERIFRYLVDSNARLASSVGYASSITGW